MKLVVFCFSLCAIRLFSLNVDFFFPVVNTMAKWSAAERVNPISRASRLPKRIEKSRCGVSSTEAACALKFLRAATSAASSSLLPSASSTASTSTKSRQNSIMCASSEPAKAFALPRELTRGLAALCSSSSRRPVVKAAPVNAVNDDDVNDMAIATTASSCTDVDRLEAAMRFLMTFFRPLFVAETSDRLALIDSEHGSHFSSNVNV